MNAVRRAVLLFPNFSDASRLAEVRSKHDPLAKKIRPHVTLVFPFDSPVGETVLGEHVASVCADFSGFELSLGRVERSDDGVLWLPVVRGAEDTRTLHDRLYAGLLTPFLDRSRPYLPHLTIAQLRSENLANAWSDAGKLRGPFNAWIDRVVIEEILSDESSASVREILFPKKR